MSDFKLNPGQGTIHKNTKKTQENQPDYRGTIVDPTGKEWSLSCWTKTAKSGNKYFSVSIQEPYKPETKEGETITEPQGQLNEDKDLPF